MTLGLHVYADRNIIFSGRIKTRLTPSFLAQRMPLVGLRPSNKIYNSDRPKKRRTPMSMAL